MIFITWSFLGATNLRRELFWLKLCFRIMFELVITRLSLSLFHWGNPSYIYIFFYLTIAIYTTHTHTLFGEGRGDSNLCQMGGNFSLAPLGQMPSGESLLYLSLYFVLFCTNNLNSLINLLSFLLKKKKKIFSLVEHT